MDLYNFCADHKNSSCCFGYDAVCQLVEEKKQMVFTKDLNIDIPFEEWINQSMKNIYVSDNRLVHNSFYKLACAGDVWNVGIRMSDKKGIVQFDTRMVT
jgi:hypothetical protein